MDIVNSIGPTLSEVALNTSYIQSASYVDLTNMVSILVYSVNNSYVYNVETGQHEPCK